ncbi:flagellar hook assembly protein FlgD [Fictibacillus sp. KIGAM418]|uniref:Flagellar hook assembly protein FlgD n=1 Tax=Fictibacillus marinisediminis TaxID=2878389 RepID=A0A9X1XAC9_9BACL|nr:flagellar hook assembly protein FlgD [Fictibacillus marinisediminis]MCK6257016.1 flagellar hook assembly protein FlgD [Fictibacillus marinisediminis]
MASSISNDLYLSNLQKKERQTGSNILGKDDFMKILMTQLQNQDPSSPMEDKEFISQMATFSSLEQMTNMSSSFDKFIAQQYDNLFIQQSSLIGKNVTYLQETQDESGAVKTESKESKVKAVLFENKEAKFQLADGNVIGSNSITQVSNEDVQASK